MVAADKRVWIDGRLYPCAEWQTVQGGQLLKVEWTEGLGGGMGEYVKRSSDRYYDGIGVDCSQPPFIRLRRAWAGTATVANLDPTLPCYAFTALETGGTTEYVYILNGRRAFKMNIGGDTLHSTKDFGAGAVCGRPAFFEGVWYVPLAGTVDYVKLTTVAVGAAADTWTSVVVTGKALHFATSMKNGIAYLTRAHTTNNVSLSADGSNYGDNFEVGSTSFAITDLLTWQTELAVVKPDRVYAFDENGNSYPVQTFITAASVAYAGANSATHGANLYWPVEGRLWRLASGRARPIDPTDDPAWAQTNDNLGLLKNATPALGALASVTTWGKWLYWTTNGDQLYFGEIQGDGSVRWHGALLTTSGGMRVQAVAASTTSPILVVCGAGAATTVGFLRLDADGGQRGSVGQPTIDQRGTASTTYNLHLGELDLGLPDKQKQLRRVWMDIESLPSTCTLSVEAAREGDLQDMVAFGSSVTTPGFKNFSWTAGSNDLAYRVFLRFKIVTSGAYSAISDPRIRSWGIEAATASLYRCRILLTAEGLREVNDDIESAKQRLRNLRNGASVTVRDPAPNLQDSVAKAGRTMTLVGHSEKMLVGGERGGQGTELELLWECFDYGS